MEKHTTSYHRHLTLFKTVTDLCKTNSNDPPRMTVDHLSPVPTTIVGCYVSCQGVLFLKVDYHDENSLELHLVQFCSI